MALDLDGTILDLKLNLDPRDVEALRSIISAACWHLALSAGSSTTLPGKPAIARKVLPAAQPE